MKSSDQTEQKGRNGYRNVRLLLDSYGKSSRETFLKLLHDYRVQTGKKTHL
jgi:hypothetical protein